MARNQKFLGCIKLETFGLVYGWLNLIYWILLLIATFVLSIYKIGPALSESAAYQRFLPLFYVSMLVSVCACILFIYISIRLINGVRQVEHFGFGFSSSIIFSFFNFTSEIIARWKLSGTSQSSG